MKLPNPSQQYDRAAEMERNRKIEAADDFNHKRNKDVEIGQTRLILTSPNGTRWNVTVSNAGTLTATAI